MLKREKEMMENEGEKKKIKLTKGKIVERVVYEFSFL